MSREITARQLARLGQSMRAEQNAYFRTRNPSVLDRARELEKQFDAMCRDVLLQMPLFESREPVAD